MSYADGSGAPMPMIYGVPGATGASCDACNASAFSPATGAAICAGAQPLHVHPHLVVAPGTQKFGGAPVDDRRPTGVEAAIRAAQQHVQNAGLAVGSSHGPSSAEARQTPPASPLAQVMPPSAVQVQHVRPTAPVAHQMVPPGYQMVPPGYQMMQVVQMQPGMNPMQMHMQRQQQQQQQAQQQAQQQQAHEQQQQQQQQQQQLQLAANHQMQQQAAAQLQMATAQPPPAQLAAGQATAPAPTGHGPPPPDMHPLRFVGMNNGQPIFQHIDNAPAEPDIFPSGGGGLVRKTPHGILQLPYVLLPSQGEQ